MADEGLAAVKLSRAREKACVIEGARARYFFVARVYFMPQP
jgi:hypothetical protein